MKKLRAYSPHRLALGLGTIALCPINLINYLLHKLTSLVKPFPFIIYLTVAYGELKDARNESRAI